MPAHVHQTARLSAGRHAEPAEGVCVMELASILTGEPFTDRPDGVCPAIAAFLRGYNDHLPDGLRDPCLLRWASDAVGSRSDDPQVTVARAAVLQELGRRLCSRSRLFAGRRPGYRGNRLFNCFVAGARAAEAVARRPRLHTEVDEVLDALCADRPPEPALHAATCEAPDRPAHAGV